MAHFAIQVHTGTILKPRLIVSAGKLHHAEKIYCEHIGMDCREIRYMGKPSMAGIPYWVETQETYEENWDLQ